MWYYNKEVGFVKDKRHITERGLKAFAYTEAEKEKLFSGSMLTHDNNGRLVVLEPEPEPETPEITIEEAKSTKLKALRAMRLAVEYGGFMLDGQRWDSELKDEQRLTSMVTLMKEKGLASFSGWKIAEGVYITLTFELALLAAEAMFMHYAACFAEESRLAEAIKALTSVEDVQNYEMKFNI